MKNKVSIIKEVTEDEFWDNADILDFERIRIELRDLMKFADGDGKKIVYTNIKDIEQDREVGKEFDMSHDYENYKLKVNQYIEENKHVTAIYKLRNNIPLTESDYKTLEKILTGELGTKEDYEYNFKDRPFGLLVRRIAKMEKEAAMKAFSTFINEQNLSSTQTAFVNKVIDYIAQNGYLENVSELIKPPFNKPQSFIKLFTPENQKKFANIINELKDNAIKVTS